MCTEEVKVVRQDIKQQILRKLFDREHIHNQCAALQSLKGKGFKEVFGGDYGSTEQNNFWVFFAEVMWVIKEGDTQLASSSGVVGSGMGEYGMSLPNECPGEKLTVVAEPNNSNFELAGVVKIGGDFGLVVVRLSSVDGSDFQATVVAEGES